jgi:hypothetical protein
MKGNAPYRSIIATMVGHPYRLHSYFYFKDLKDPKAFMRYTVDDPSGLIVDSGLYSFMFGSERGKMPSTYQAYRDYTRRYIDDMIKWDFPCILVESDTHYLLGMDDTLRLREEFAPLGSRVMYVWHRPEGFDGLIKLAKERDYISLGIPELRMLASGGKSVSGSSRMAERMSNDLISRVHAACGDKPPRIHLLGCTVESMMESRLVWSCDSTSWLSGLRFGQGRIWTADKGLVSAGIRSPKFRRFAKIAEEACPEAAEYAKRQSSPEYFLNSLACSYAYALYQQFLDSRFSPIPMRGDALPGGSIDGRPEGAPVERGTKNVRSRRNRSEPVESERSE